MSDRVLSAIGLARRAGKTVSGGELVTEAIRSHKALLVIAATDISPNSRKKIVGACEFHGVEYIEYAAMEELSGAQGMKKLICSTAVTDENFKKLIMQQYKAATQND